jgi:hypothetical protein
VKQIFPRQARPEELQSALEWAGVAEPAAARNPSTVYCAHNGKPVAFVTALPVICLEDLATNPEATELEKAAAIKSLIHGIAAIAAERGIDEIFFFAGNMTQESIRSLALHHGFEMIPHPMYSLRLR